MGCCPRSLPWWATRCARTCCPSSRLARAHITFPIRSLRDPGRQRSERGTKVHTEPSQISEPCCRFWIRRRTRRLEGQRLARPAGCPEYNLQPNPLRAGVAGQGQSCSTGLSFISAGCCAPRFAETSFRADMIRRRVTMKTQIPASGGVGLGRGGRMSRQRKRDAVLRLLRGEDLEILSRALGVTASTLSGWQHTFVAAGEASLAKRSTAGEALETERLKAKLGEMLLERELLDAKIAALEANRPLARRRSRR